MTDRRHQDRWALVLAAGDGSRLARFTAQGGEATPKQYCSLAGGPTLLEATLERAFAVAAPERTVAVVAGAHRRHWTRDLRALPRRNVVVQPQNRGTAAGILLPLLAILERDPEARVVVLPSDHHVADETALGGAVEEAFGVLDRDGDRLVLLGITPDGDDGEYGWIVPAAAVAGARGVARFVEKPPAAEAAGLRRAGALWNSFLMVGRVATIVERIDDRLPGLPAMLWAARAAAEAIPSSNALEVLYGDLRSSDFSRDVLQGSEGGLAVVAVPSCGWSDLGTPERVLRTLATLTPSTLAPTLSTAGLGATLRAPFERAPFERVPFDLAAAALAFAGRATPAAA